MEPGQAIPNQSNQATLTPEPPLNVGQAPLTSPTDNTPDKNLTSLTDDEILHMRTAMDNISWSLFNKDFISSDGNVILIDYLNIFLIESFNWFGTEGLASIFANKEFVIPKIGIVKIVEHKLEFPRKDDLGDTNSLLWPAEAVLGKIDYSGYLMVKAEITWDSRETGKSGTEPLSVDWFPLGKIPIMVGSSFCNLSSIRTKKHLVSVGECSTEYLAYYISKGNKRNLISQNYLKANNEVCIFSKMGVGNTRSVTTCNMRSRGLDGDMLMHKIFIMKLANNKITHSDRRIYFQITPPGWTKKNSYDAGTSIVGINLVSIFRLATILMYTIDPLAQTNNYLFGDLPGNPGQGMPDMRAGHLGQSTFEGAAANFSDFIREYAGDKFFKLIQNYIADTINEASLEREEMNFWEQTIVVEGLEHPSNKATSEKAIPLLEIFARQLFPHLSSSPITGQLREIRRLKEVAHDEIIQAHRRIGLGTNPYEIDVTILAIKNIYDLYRARDARFNYALETLQRERGINMSVDVPNCNRAVQLYEVVQNDMRTKLQMLAYMTVKVLRVELGIDTYDNRDSLANQTYEHAGMLMNNRFSSMLRDIGKSLAGEIKVANPEIIKRHLEKVGESIVTREFSDNFARGEWHSKSAGKARTGVTDLMPASIIAAQLAYLRRVSAQSKGLSKSTASRELTGLQLGAICPSETPEGKQCGNVEHLAATAFLTNESFDSQTLAYKLVQNKTSRRRGIENIDEAVRNIMSKDNIPKEISKLLDPTGELCISGSRRKDKDTPLFLNGRPMGWVDGLSFRRKLIDMRRRGYIHPHTGVHYYQKPTQIGIVRVLKVETSGGRIVQPLIIAEDPQKTVNILWSLANNPRLVSDMIAEGVIEFIDSAELEFLDLAPSVDVYLKAIQNGLPGRFDHIMLNPSFLMGVAANIMPFANMNPVVRNSYFTQMVKQPYGVPAANFMERAHTAIAKLHDPQKPLVQTDMHQKVLENDLFGRNVNILITTHKQGEEDGIIINRRFLDLGGLSSTKYSAFPIQLKHDQELDFQDDFRKTTEDPDRYGRGIIRVTKKVLKQNPDGTTTIVEEPVIVKPNEILARKTWIKGDVQKNAFETVSYESLREGIVDRIVWSKASEGSKMIYVIIKTPDDLWVGDKLYSRFSQKGVIAAVVPNDQMPLDAETGETPDLIINPQAFPSRMTIGMLAEILVANAHVFPDKNKNVYVLYEDIGFDIYAPLERLFVVDKKVWDNYNFDNEKVKHEDRDSEFGTEQTQPTIIPLPNQREAHKLVRKAYDQYYSLVKDALIDKAIKLKTDAEQINNNVNNTMANNGKVSNIFSDLGFPQGPPQFKPSAMFQPGFQPGPQVTAAPIFSTTNTSIQPNQPMFQSSPIIEPLQAEPPKEYVVISSELVNDQDTMDFLRMHDEASKFMGFENGLWAMRFYSQKDINGKFNKTIGNARFIIVQSPALNPSVTGQTSTQALSSLTHILDLLPGFREYLANIKNNQTNTNIYGYLFPEEFIETIEDVWFDTQKNDDDEFINPMRGIKISNIPENDISSDFSEIGTNLKQLYITGNAYTPVPDQHIAGYRPKFFQKLNLKSYFFDFTIPEEYRIIKGIIVPGEQFSRDFQLPSNTLYSMLAKQTDKITIVKWIQPGPGMPESPTPSETTLLGAWEFTHGSEIPIPPQNVINLPEQARDVFLKRKEKIKNLRTASLFKAGLDVNDAMKELTLMGYNPDATREYINPATGKTIEGAIAGGWSFYMGSKHKVKEKMQGRGEGKHDARTGQPIQGKNYGGGIRFNFADARATIVSGGAGVVYDRLLEASNRKDSFICDTCKEVCWRKEGIQSIVCPICRQETETTKISVPYTFLLERNLMMGAGVRFKIYADRDKQDHE